MKISINTKSQPKAEQSSLAETSEKKEAKFPNFLISLSLFALFFGIPLFFTGITLQGAGFDKMMYFYFWVMIGVIAWAIKGVSEGEFSFRRTPLDIPILLVLIVFLANSILSVNKYDSFLGGFGVPSKSFLVIFAGAVFYWFLVSNITEKRLRMILRSIMFSAGIIGVFMAAKFTGLWDLILKSMKNPPLIPPFQRVGDAGFNTVGMMGDLSVFAFASLLIVIARSVYPAKRDSDAAIPSKESKNAVISHNHEQRDCFVAHSATLHSFLAMTVKVFVSLILIYIVLSLFSYINPYILLIPLAIIIIFSISKLVPISKFQTYFTVSLFAGVLILAIMNIRPQTTKAELPAEVGLSMGASWNIAKEAIKEKWAMGSGIGTYGYGFSKYRPRALNQTALWQAKFSESALFAEVLATGGIIGAVCFVILLLSYIGVAVTVIARSVNPAKRDSDAAIPPKESITAAANHNREQRDCFVTHSATLHSFLAMTLMLFSSSVLLIIYSILHLSSAAILLYAVMLAALTIAGIALLFKEGGQLSEGARLNEGGYTSPENPLLISPFQRGSSSQRRGYAILFKEYALTYESAPQYALAMSFVFVCLITGAVAMFAVLGKIFIADVYARQSVLAGDNLDLAAARMANAVNLAQFQDEYLIRLGGINLQRAVNEMSVGIGCANPQTESEKTFCAGKTSDKEKARQLFISSLNAYKLAVAKAPQDSGAWESLASASEAAANYDPALLDSVMEAYQKSAELSPSNPLIQIRLGMLKMILGDSKNTSKNSKEGEEPPLAPPSKGGDAEVINIYQEAKDCYNKAIGLRRDLLEAHEGLASVEERLGNIERAIEIYQMLLSAQPKAESYPYKIGLLYEALEKKEDAKKYFEMAISNIGSREGSEDVIKAVKERIESLNLDSQD